MQCTTSQLALYPVPSDSEASVHPPLRCRRPDDFFSAHDMLQAAVEDYSAAHLATLAALLAL